MLFSAMKTTGITVFASSFTDFLFTNDYTKQTFVLLFLRIYKNTHRENYINKKNNMGAENKKRKYVEVIK